MEIRHCPKCGSDDIDVSSFSAEYMRSTRYECQDCSYWYKSGSGMGTGSSNEGTHPRSVSSGGSGQKQLVETGSWCSTCEMCAKPGYCGCVEDHQTGFCKKCAEYSEYDTEQLLEVTTYFGKYQDSPFECAVCGENKAELKTEA